MNGLLEIVAGGRGGGLLRKEAQKGGRLAADSAAARDDAFGERGAAQRVDDGNAVEENSSARSAAVGMRPSTTDARGEWWSDSRFRWP